MRGDRSLSRDRILDAARALVDEEGLGALSMRAVARRLGSGTMSLYNHVAGKDDLLDGITDALAARFPLPEGPDWKSALRASIGAAHALLLAHPWACTTMASRPTVGPARLRYYDALLGVLHGAGFEPTLARRGFLALDAHLLGFTLQETQLPWPAAERAEAAAGFAAAVPADVYPHMARMVAQLVESGDFDYPFDFVLDLLLDGLERARDG